MQIIKQPAMLDPLVFSFKNLIVQLKIESFDSFKLSVCNLEQPQLKIEY